jgi:hypothetical protein
MTKEQPSDRRLEMTHQEICSDILSKFLTNGECDDEVLMGSACGKLYIDGKMTKTPYVVIRLLQPDDTLQCGVVIESPDRLERFAKCDVSCQGKSIGECVFEWQCDEQNRRFLARLELASKQARDDFAERFDKCFWINRALEEYGFPEDLADFVLRSTADLEMRVTEIQRREEGVWDDPDNEDPGPRQEPFPTGAPVIGVRT